MKTNKITRNTKYYFKPWQKNPKSPIMQNVQVIFNTVLKKFTVQSLRKKYPYSELFWSECGKMWTRITPNMDAFHAVNKTDYWQNKIY